MNPEQPGGPEGDMTIRRPRPRPAPPPPRSETSPYPLPPPRNAAPLFPQNNQPPPQDERTRRLDYPQDLLPDVAYETGKSRSGWWWLVVMGGLLLLVAAVAVAVVLRAGA